MKSTMRLLLALLALPLGSALVWGQNAEEKAATVAYLRSLQASDGGFLPARAGNGKAVSGLGASAAAIRALNYFRGQPKDKDACIEFVKSCFDPQSGGFADRPGGKPGVVVTAVGLMALTALKLPADSYQEKAIGYLDENAHSFEEVRMAAAGLEAIHAHSPKTAAWLKQVAEMRNVDGTYGRGDGQARDTASAVVTVLRLGGTVEHRDRVIQALREGQRQDGGFGQEGAPGSDLESSYRIMRAFFMLRQRPDGRRLRAFVSRCRNADGGYGVAPGKPSGAGPTYYAASILHWLGQE
jgi:prenyltransferase beta subunit